jgi:RNA polymerase sigma factor (sigma-70 family)
VSSFAMPAGGLPRRLALTRSSGSGSQGRYQGRYAGFAPPAEGAGLTDGDRSGAGGAGIPAAAEPGPAPVSAAVDAVADAPVPDVAWTPPSWEEIVREHSARIYRLAYRLTGNQHDAEDLTQEVFVRVFRSLSSYTPGTFEGWMHRITTNLFLDQARRKQRIRFDALPDDSGDRLAGREPGPELAWEHNNLDYDVQAALDTLPPDFRAAVVLCDIEGLSYEEIAATLDVKLGTVRSRIHRGRALLRQELAHRRPGRVCAQPVSEPGPGEVGA